MRRNCPRAAAILVLGVFAGLEPRAETRQFGLEVPDGRGVSFDVELPVEHPGEIGIRAEWSCPRVLSFVVRGPGGGQPRARRSGPSPQAFRVGVSSRDLVRRGPWSLRIHALPGGGGGRGSLWVELPDPPRATAPADRTAAPEPPRVERWALAAPVPPGATEQVARLHDLVERFRREVVDAQGSLVPDACQWHSGALAYLAEWRDRFSRAGALPLRSTRRYLGRLAEAAGRVEQLRSSPDPLLAGPGPPSAAERRAWLMARRRVFEPLERELDSLLESLGAGHAPELETQPWPRRLVSCVLACERYFEQRARLGEERATNAELAASAWKPILAATQAFAELSLATPGRAAAGDEESAP
jgi:hypothetical protein